MEFKELLDEIQIEGAGQGDVVFVEVADSMSAQEFVRFGEAFRAHANSIRADGFFPRCIILPPGTRAVVAQRKADDEIAIEGDVTASDRLAAIADAGCPHG
jgi:hypothetical protein